MTKNDNSQNAQQPFEAAGTLVVSKTNPAISWSNQVMPIMAKRCIWLERTSTTTFTMALAPAWIVPIPWTEVMKTMVPPSL